MTYTLKGGSKKEQETRAKVNKLQHTCQITNLEEVLALVTSFQFVIQHVLDLSVSTLKQSNTQLHCLYKDAVAILAFHHQVNHQHCSSLLSQITLYLW